jgi:general secretion pathway protein G
MKRRIWFVYLLVIHAIALGCGIFYLQYSLRQKREAMLRLDLNIVRQAILDYTRDKDQGPQSLQDLIDAQYLNAIPTDPFTSQKDWVSEFADAELRADHTAPKIASVHSASDRVGCAPIPYKFW